MSVRNLGVENLYRSMLSPELPTVRLSFVEPEDYKELFVPDKEADVFSVKQAESKTMAGFLAIVCQATDEGNFAYVDYVIKTNQSAAKGTFLAAYIAAAAWYQSESFILRSGLVLSDHSLNIWQILIRAGIAYNPVSFVREVHDGENFYYGAAYVHEADDIQPDKALCRKLHAEVGGDF